MKYPQERVITSSGDDRVHPGHARKRDGGGTTPVTSTYDSSRINAQMLAAFYTDTDACKGQVISQARQSIFQAVQGLSGAA